MTQQLEQTVGQAIRAQRDALAQTIVARQYALEPERWQQYGKEGREKSVRDAGSHLMYLAEAIAVSDTSLFSDYVVWARALFVGLGLGEDVIVRTLECTRHVLAEMLPAEMSAVAGEYIDVGLREMKATAATPPSYLDPDMPLADLAQKYLTALLRGERRAASRLVLDAVERGVEVKEVYLQVFQPVQREVGRLWQLNRVSVAQEHYCTAATQLIMSQLYPRIFSTEKNGRRLVATCVGGELHEIGVRMVADFFEMEGWDTYYLGANTPADAIVGSLAEHRADLLAVSATMTFHVSAVRDLIGRVRASTPMLEVRILVGGYPFNVSPELWRQVGADGCARDAQEAVALANRLMDQGA